MSDQQPYNCVICHFPVEADDAMIPIENGKCICKRCYTRETESEVAMGKLLKRDLEDCLAELAVGTLDASDTYAARIQQPEDPNE